MSKTATATAAPEPFVELEPEVLDTVRAKPADDERDPKVIDLDAQARAESSRFDSLPASGPGTIRVTPIGSRVILTPSDRGAAEALAIARHQIGFDWDGKQQRRIHHFDTMTRRGVTQWDSLRLVAMMTGLDLDMVPSGERSIARYNARLERQLRPIPRFTWADDTAEGRAAADEEEINIDAGSRFRSWSSALHQRS